LCKKYAKQPNRLLVPGKFYYDKAIGVKSGYIANAGYCFVGAAEDEERTLIAVVLGCKESHQRYRDALALFDAAFAEKKESRKLYKEREAKFKVTLQKKELIATVHRDITYDYFPSEELPLKSDVKWTKKALPVAAGEEVGQLRILDPHGRALFCEPLYAEEELLKPSRGWIWLIIGAPLLLPLLIKVRVKRGVRL
jgi:D-alanyl-D-alanine carboxypeptidase (penicillin-binding protein 5/6)